MSTIALDTHQAIQRLTAQGFSTEQAEGIVEVLANNELVSKSDLKVAVSELKVWVVVMLLAQAALIVALQTLIG